MRLKKIGHFDWTHPVPVDEGTKKEWINDVVQRQLKRGGHRSSHIASGDTLLAITVPSKAERKRGAVVQVYETAIRNHQTFEIEEE